MRKLGAIVLVTLVAILAIADIIHDFIANDPLHYFSEQPHQLLVVAAIAIVGGLITFFFYRLSPHWQWRGKADHAGFGGFFSDDVRRLFRIPVRTAFGF